MQHLNVAPGLHASIKDARNQNNIVLWKIKGLWVVELRQVQRNVVRDLFVTSIKLGNVLKRNRQNVLDQTLIQSIVVLNGRKLQLSAAPTLFAKDSDACVRSNPKASN